MAFKAWNLELADSRRAHYYEGPMAGPMEGPVTIQLSVDQLLLVDVRLIRPGDWVAFVKVHVPADVFMCIRRTSPPIRPGDWVAFVCGVNFGVQPSWIHVMLNGVSCTLLRIVQDHCQLQILVPSLGDHCRAAGRHESPLWVHRVQLRTAAH
jgi:hypothetical protein